MKEDDLFNRFKHDMRAFLSMLSSDSGPLGNFGNDLSALAGECRELLDAMDREPVMDVGFLETRLKVISVRIEDTIQILTEAHARTFRTMTSIGNRKRIKKTYENDILT